MRTYFWKNEEVILESFQEDDCNSLVQALGDTQYRLQTEHMMTLPFSEHDAAYFIERARECLTEGEDIWLTIRNHEEEMVGYCSLTQIDERAGNLQLMITVFPEHQRRGYAKAACHILLEYAFLERRMHKVNACTTGTNQAGQQFALAVGFLQEAERTEMFYAHGAYESELYYGILKDEYLGEKKTSQVSLQIQWEGRQNHGGSMACAKDFNTGSNYWEYEGLRFRQMEEADYYVNHEIVFDSMSCRFYDADVKLPDYREELTPRDQEHLHFEGADGRLEFAVTDLEDQYIGNVNLCGIDERNGRFSLSIYLCPNARGKGYGTKMLRRILSYAFLELRMHKFITIVNDGNIASEMSMKHVGCKVEGIRRENIYYMGNYVDEIFLGVTKDEFLEFHK